MNILVCPNTLVAGGASMVALDLAAALQARGHRVVVLAAAGPLARRLEERNLRWVAAPPTSDGTAPGSGPLRPTWPSPAVIRLVRSVAAAERIDVVHTFEWLRCLEATFGAHLLDGVPLVSSILHVDAPRFLPRTASYVVGTERLRDVLDRRGVAVTLVEPALAPPPVDAAGAAGRFRAEHGLRADVATAVVASRLAGGKLEGIRSAIAAVDLLADELPVQLVVAGDGEGAPELRELAAEVNHRLGRRAVLLTGFLDDVGPAYASADVVVGMGSSLVQGMALGKPAIVVGRNGFVQVLTETTAAGLADVGYWGDGAGEAPVAALAGHLRTVLADPEAAGHLGEVSRRWASRRPSVADAAARTEAVYAAALARPVTGPSRTATAARSFGRFAAMRARWWAHRRRAVISMPAPAPAPVRGTGS
jgi:glycosyltransferase involved in cell wall biosynthesis